MAMIETLCWTCGRACSHDCPWAESGKPVQGWDAIKNKATESYTVLKCPLFVKDQPLTEIDTDGAQNMVAGIIRQTVSDYEKGTAQNVPHIEKFVRGNFFQAISNIDPERLITLMRAKRKARMQKIAMLRGGR